MTKIDLPGPSLNEAQWGSLRALATSLTAEQSNWVGGYFTGYAVAVRLAGAALAPATPQPPAAQVETGAAQRTLTVLYGSETGNGIEQARRRVDLGTKRNVRGIGLHPDQPIGQNRIPQADFGADAGNVDAALR
jgi:sulfite reductase (NADPH) flavoprotein alpha-component